MPEAIKEKIESFNAIEQNILIICSRFKEILQKHGLAKGEIDNFKTGIHNNMQLQKSKENFTLTQLFMTWSKVYASKASTLRSIGYVGKIKDLTGMIYSEDETEESIVTSLERLYQQKKEMHFENKIMNLLESIKDNCRKLIKIADLLEEFIFSLEEHSKYLRELIESESQLETIKELEFADKALNKMKHLGDDGWDIVSDIYSDEKKSSHIFNRLATMLN
ncbi:MAG: hypothetical protein U9O94_05325 [Nanoarchaeota archaeon]|nr:hypothetical protein [Nanoarchaeota archaeon]